MDHPFALAVLLALVLAGGLVVLTKRQGLGGFQPPTLDGCERMVHDYLARRRYMEAMVIAKKATKVNPSDPIGEVLLTRVYIAQGKRSKARATLRRC